MHINEMKKSVHTYLIRQSLVPSITITLGAGAIAYFTTPELGAGAALLTSAITGVVTSVCGVALGNASSFVLGRLADKSGGYDYYSHMYNLHVMRVQSWKQMPGWFRVANDLIKSDGGVRVLSLPLVALRATSAYAKQRLNWMVSMKRGNSIAISDQAMKGRMGTGAAATYGALIGLAVGLIGTYKLTKPFIVEEALRIKQPATQHVLNMTPVNPVAKYLPVGNPLTNG